MDAYENIKLGEKELLELSDSSQDWLSLHGVVMRNNSDVRLMNYAPFTLFPSPFPKYLYNEAITAQIDFQELFKKASDDHQFIEDSLKSVIVHDEFTKRQYEIYDLVREEGIKPKLTFNITRSDYMLDGSNDETRPYEIKQIEMNMIAASFGGLGTMIHKLHRYNADVLGEKYPATKEKIDPNSTIEKLGDGMAQLWKLYRKENSIIVFVVEDGEKNRFDQRLLEYSFHDGIKKMGIEKHVHVFFLSLQQINQHATIDEHRNCFIDGKEVALFYFRAAYVPAHYKDEDCWAARLMIERSTAVKTPTMAENLVGTKKVQQVLAQKGQVERFIKCPEKVQRIRRTFARLFTLDEGEEGDIAAQMALKEPSKFVLKPQREGGGNNMYDEDLVKQLKRATDPLVRSQYILMERVRPPVVKNYVVHVSFDKPQLTNTVTELGVFGVIITSEGETVRNETCGHLMRTKNVDYKDGGVAAGVAVLDTPYLV